MKSGKGLKRIVLLGVAVLLLLGLAAAAYKFVLKKEVTKEVLVGHYKLDYGYGVSILELRKDGTYSHEYSGVDGKTKGVKVVSTGKWEMEARRKKKPIRVIFYRWYEFTEAAIDLDPEGVPRSLQPMIPYSRTLGGVELLYLRREGKADLIFKSVDP